MDNDLHFLRFADAVWNVGAFCSHDKVFAEFYDIIKAETGEELIASVHGCPRFCLWNGGRLSGALNKEEIHNDIKIHWQRNIPIYLTFSNCTLKMEDLSDKPSNYMLDLIADTENCGVIVCEDILSKYIQDKYPNLTQISSVIRTVVHGKPNNPEYYNEAAKKFYKVVLDVDDGYNFELLKKLHDKDKFEIMLNEFCVRKCPYHKKHYLMAMREMDILQQEELEQFTSRYCMKEHGKMSHVGIGGENSDRRPYVEFAIDELNKVYNLGFRSLKVQGRAYHKAVFMYYLCRYVLKDNIAPLFYHHFAEKI